MRTRYLAAGVAAVAALGGGGALAVMTLHLGQGHPSAQTAAIVMGADDPRTFRDPVVRAPAPTAPPAKAPATSAPPRSSSGSNTVAASHTHWHFTANSNFDGSERFLPGSDGFNLADAGSVSDVNSLPAGDKALVWVGLCNGADATFTNTVSPYIGNPRVFGFYVMDEPDPTGQWNTLCTAANLKAESDWIHAHVPGTRAFIIMMNLGPNENPSYQASGAAYTPQNSHLDLVGLDPYPVRSGSSPDYSEITKSVAAAKAIGWSQGAIVPVFQAFGGGSWSGGWILPTPAQEQQMLATWSTVAPAPAFDYAYSWGSQNGDTALSQSPGLQQVFAAHNR